MNLPDWIPDSEAGWWRIWLDYRIPHWDRLEREAAKTLTGSRTAVVRVGWDARTSSCAEWHATLFTLECETPSPGETEDAVRPATPAGVLLHHVVASVLPPEAETPPDPRSAELVSLVHAAHAAGETRRALKKDSRCPREAVERVEREADELRERARNAVEAAIRAGLQLRVGMLLVPPVVLKPEALHDQAVYGLLRGLHRSLVVVSNPIDWKPSGVAVCASCTTVFVPRRRTTAAYCGNCSRRPAAEAFGMRALRVGEPQTIRVPDLVGTMIIGWKTKTIAICPGCNDPFVGRSDASRCRRCANRDRKRRQRERQHGAGSEADS
jgi:hypothetical protein